MKWYVALIVVILMLCAPLASLGLAGGLSITDGFRGVPWGIKESEAKSYGLINWSKDDEAKLYYSPIHKDEYNNTYRRKNENNSFGNIPLLGIKYNFTNENNENIFNSVEIVADKNYDELLIQELIDFLGKPTYIFDNFSYYDIVTSRSYEWILSNLRIKSWCETDSGKKIISRSFYSRAKITIERSQKGGGL